MAKRKRKRKNKNKMSKGLIFAVTAFIMGVAMTVAANNTTLKGFQAQSIQNKIQKLQEENKELEFKATNLKSLQSVTNSAEVSGGMTKVEDLKHIIPSKKAQNESASVTNKP